MGDSTEIPKPDTRKHDLHGVAGDTSELPLQTKEPKLTFMDLPWEIIGIIMNHLEAADVGNLYNSNGELAVKMSLNKCRVTTLTVDRIFGHKLNVRVLRDSLRVCSMIDTGVIDFKRVEGEINENPRGDPEHALIVNYIRARHQKMVAINGFGAGTSHQYINREQDAYIELLAQKSGCKLRKLTLRNYVFGTVRQMSIIGFWENLEYLELSMDKLTWVDDGKCDIFFRRLDRLREIKVRNIMLHTNDSNMIMSLPMNTTLARVEYQAPIATRWNYIFEVHCFIAYLKCQMGKSFDDFDSTELIEAYIEVPVQYRHYDAPDFCFDAVKIWNFVRLLKKLTIRVHSPSVAKRILVEANKDRALVELNIIEIFVCRGRELRQRRLAREELAKFENIERKTYCLEKFRTYRY